MAKSIRIQLPLREFMYTLDQLALLLNVTVENLSQNYIYFDGVSAGTMTGRMIARDLSQDKNHRDWRVAESSFRLFLTRRGWSVVEPHVRP